MTTDKTPPTEAPSFLTDLLDQLFLRPARSASVLPKKVPFSVDTDELPVIFKALTTYADSLTDGIANLAASVADASTPTTGEQNALDQARIDQAHATLLALRVKRLMEVNDV